MELSYKIKYCTPYIFQNKHIMKTEHICEIQYLFYYPHNQFDSLKISNMTIILKLIFNFIPLLC